MYNKGVVTDITTTIKWGLYLISMYRYPEVVCIPNGRFSTLIPLIPNAAYVLEVCCMTLFTFIQESWFAIVIIVANLMCFHWNCNTTCWTYTARILGRCVILSPCVYILTHLYSHPCRQWECITTNAGTVPIPCWVERITNSINYRCWVVEIALYTYHCCLKRIVQLINHNI